MKYDAFISYRRDNGFLMAQLIRDRMKERGIHCFLDLEDDRAGKFNERLLEVIAGAPNFILILPKDTLDRCREDGDWVRREILAAMEGKKKIIPVMFEDFSWPETWPEGIPEAFRQLPDYQGVSTSQVYLSAMMDKLAEYITGGGFSKSSQETQSSTRATEHFFREQLRRPGICEVDMAFHAGSEWRRTSELVTILEEMRQKNIPIRVLVNDPKAVKSICVHMRNPLQKYTGFQKSTKDWKELMDLCLGMMEVRVSSLPMLHRIYLIRREDGTDVADIKYYTYGNCIPGKDARLRVHSDAPEYALYRDEFEYLWERAMCLPEKSKKK